MSINNKKHGRRYFYILVSLLPMLSLAACNTTTQVITPETSLVFTPEDSAGYARGLEAAQRQDFASALKEWKPLADRGHIDAQFNLGILYLEQGPIDFIIQGERPRRNFAPAIKWFKRAANQGHLDAQIKLGALYSTRASYRGGIGGGVKDALKWYTLAAEQGHVDSQSQLGFMYSSGRFGPQNHKLAVKWHTLAAKQNKASAQLHLGRLYEKGRGVAQNYKVAVKWFILSAEQRNPNAQYSLGLMYQNGHGVQQDNVRALMWMIVATSSGGFGPASEKGNALARKMTPIQMKEAVKLARECKNKSYIGC